MPYKDPLARRACATASARRRRTADPAKYVAEFKRRYAANPEKWHAYWIKRYGITKEQYDAMFVRQKGLCAICSKPPKTRRLAVEHDHGPSKRVRGLCCAHCNRFYIGKNTAATARRVLTYLESEFDGRAIRV